MLPRVSAFTSTLRKKGGMGMVNEVGCFLLVSSSSSENGVGKIHFSLQRRSPSLLPSFPASLQSFSGC